MATVKSVSFNMQTKDFDKAVDHNIALVKAQTKNILIASSTQFAAGAATYTPPSMKKAVIEKKYWTRPVQYIPSLAKNNRATQEDIQMLRKGFLFKVVYNKAGVKKGTAFAYCKKLSQTKKFAKITTRGLSRVMWGKNLNSIGAKVPTVITSILKRSKDVAKVNLNTVELKSNKDQHIVQIENAVASIERYAKIALNQGYLRAEKAINKQLKKVAEKDKKL